MWGHSTKIEKLLFILLIFLSIGSFVYYYSHGLTLAYGDAKSHLNIARRVLFSLTPSLTQLGGIWLPLPHILMLPTIWNTFMYYSGLSGSIISMISYVVIVVVIFKAIYFYTKSLISSLLGASIIALNPGFLYFQTTPMTEPLSIALAVVPIYLLMKWTKSNNLLLLVTAALITALSTLCRYDNLFLIPASALTIIVVMLLKHSKRKSIEGKVLLFLTLASFGIFLWLLYNQVIFGNVLNFALGQGSASWFAVNQHSYTMHNLYLSIMTFGWLIVDNIGISTLVLMTIGILIFSIKYRIKAESIPAYLFLVPIFFNITSLYLGQSIAHTPHLPPFNFYNTRYGINVLPAAAFFIGIIGSKFRSSMLFIVPIICIQYYIFFRSPLALILDGLNGKNKSEPVAASWIENHQVNGLVLISTGTFDALVFDSKIPEEKIIYEGSGIIWKESLENPKKYASRIIVGENIFGNGNDPVGKSVLKIKELKIDYHEVFTNPYITIYDRNY